MSAVVTYQSADGVATVTIDRAERMNALDEAVVQGLNAAWRRFADSTVFKYPEAQLGFTGGLIASAVARIPHKVAMEFMLLGEDFDAERALQAGMVNKVVPAGEELDAARAWAGVLAKSAPLVVTTLKTLAMQTLNKSPAEAGALAREKLLRVAKSEDGAKGGRAFREKRTPVFHGR